MIESMIAAATRFQKPAWKIARGMGPIFRSSFPHVWQKRALLSFWRPQRGQ
jgi:hypothetical protein